MPLRGTRSRQAALAVGLAVLFVVVPFGGGLLTATDLSGGNGTGNIVVTTQNDGIVAEYDANGTQVWAYGNASRYFDVTPLSEGRFLLAFTDHGYRGCGEYDSPCAHTGARIIETEPEPHTVFEWSFPLETTYASETHDVQMLPDGDILVLDMSRERVLRVDREAREVVWRWNATDHYGGDPERAKGDWLHINDVDRIGHERYLVSARNNHQLLVIDQDNGVVETIDGQPAGRNLFRFQHNPHWIDNDTVLIADSDNDRVVELHRENGSWELAWVLSRIDGVGLDWPRDADRLPNGNTLIADTVNNRVVEVTRTGDTVASYHLQYDTYEADAIPDGERAVGDPYPAGVLNQVDRTREDIGGGVPLLTPLLRGVQLNMWLPYWVSELHVLAVLLAGLALGMAAERLTSHRAYALAVVLEETFDGHATQRDRLRAAVSAGSVLVGIILVGWSVVATIPELLDAVVTPSFVNLITAFVIGVVLVAVGWIGLLGARRDAYHRPSTRTLVAGKYVVLLGVTVATALLAAAASQTAQFLTTYLLLGTILVVVTITLFLTPARAA
jgi:hypothetical protein